MELTEFVWLGIHDLEIEQGEFQSSIVWKNKFVILVSELEGKISESQDDNDPTLKIENIILNIWDSLQNNFILMKNPANALLAVVEKNEKKSRDISTINLSIKI